MKKIFITSAIMFFCALILNIDLAWAPIYNFEEEPPKAPKKSPSQIYFISSKPTANERIIKSGQGYVDTKSPENIKTIYEPAKKNTDTPELSITVPAEIENEIEKKPKEEVSEEAYEKDKQPKVQSQGKREPSPPKPKPKEKKK